MNRDLARTLLRSSWWAILVGLVLEGLQLAAARMTTGTTPDGSTIVAETAQKVTWSYIVCVALACGTAASRAAPHIVGLVGLFAAPLAFGLARAAHKSLGQVLSVTVPSGGPSPWTLAGIKALEYAIFGVLLARLIRKPELRLPRYVVTGLVMGVVFGAWLLWVMDSAAPGGLPAPALLSRGINEVLFPVGCACVVWVSGVLARR